MTRNLLSGRISGSGLVAFGDNQIVQFENDVADVFQIPKDSVLGNPVMAIDVDGNISHWTNADDPGAPVTGFMRFKDTESYNGFRIWDTTNDREVLIRLKDGKFIITEASDAGTDSPTWHDKFSFPLASAAGQNIDFDLTDQGGKYIKVKSDETGIEYAADPGMVVPTVKVYFDSAPQTISKATDTDVTFEEADWDLHGSMWDAGFPKGVLVPQTGVYLIEGYLEWAGTFGTGYRQGEFVYDADGQDLTPEWNILQKDRRSGLVVSGVAQIVYQSFSAKHDLSAGWFVGLRARQDHTPVNGTDLNLLQASLSLTLLAVE